MEEEYGDEESDDGLSAPVVISAKKTPGLNVSGTTTLLPPSGKIRIEQYEENAYSTRNLDVTGDEQLRPSSIFKQAAGGADVNYG